MKGIISRKEMKYYTDMNLVLSSIEDYVLNYNWLITDIECNHYPNPILDTDDAIWLSGSELLKIVKADDIQFIWGVFSAFSQEITYEEINKCDIYPDAHVYEGFWHLPLKIQHSLAEIEIVAWDSSLLLLLSNKDSIVEKFKRTFTLSEDLEEHLSNKINNITRALP